MNRPTLQGPVPRSRPGMRAAVLMAGIAVAVGSLAAMSLLAAPGDVIDAKRGEIRVLEAEVLRIDAQAADAADAHAAAVRRADELRVRIAETNRGLAEARAARAVAVERLSERIRGLYTEEAPSLVEIVLASGGLTAAVDTQRAIEAIGEQDARIVTQIQAARTRLTRLRAELEGGRSAVEASVSESAARLTEMRGLISDRRRVLDDAQATLDRLVEGDRERRAARLAAAEAAAERALLRRADPGAQAAASDPAPSADPAPATPASAPASGGVSAALERIAQCESGGNPQAVSASGQYRGKYQFDLGTWQSLGGTGDPAAAPEAEQDRLAALLYAQRGPAPWPVCGYR